jgi:hypothetical protein
MMWPSEYNLNLTRQKPMSEIADNQQNTNPATKDLPLAPAIFPSKL